MNIIKVRKKPEDLDDVAFLKEALREMQKTQKNQGKKFNFDIEERDHKTYNVQ